MVKVVAPLGSFSASGSLGPRLVFSQRSTGQQVRYQRAQKNKITPARVIARSIYSLAVQQWRDLSIEQKELYRVLAVPLGWSGYNLFVQKFILEYVPPVVDEGFVLYPYTAPLGDQADFILSAMV